MGEREVCTEAMDESERESESESANESATHRLFLRGLSSSCEVAIFRLLGDWAISSVSNDAIDL